MRVLMIGSGGVGDAAARIAAERDFFELWVVADFDVARAQRTVREVTQRHTADGLSGGPGRFVAAQVDAS
ncbi:MAG TPA: saccharopine dehydrogenase NADP-binding domain-containing protein, partial [Intrasporangium sp.]|uniref:saccharopine dehydrogenase NADP-binding domain-containing protein n=1 Tax=Intrasporangium sp. TaxID=1925024 RepID=UPI002B45FAC7